MLTDILSQTILIFFHFESFDRSQCITQKTLNENYNLPLQRLQKIIWMLSQIYRYICTHITVLHLLFTKVSADLNVKSRVHITSILQLYHLYPVSHLHFYTLLYAKLVFGYFVFCRIGKKINLINIDCNSVYYFFARTLCFCAFKPSVNVTTEVNILYILKLEASP